MFGLFHKTESAFGLDLSAGSLKLVQFEKRGKETQLKSYTDATLPKGLIINDAVADNKIFSYLLRQAVEKPQFGRISSNFAVASLPEAKSFVRVIQIPRMSSEEAEKAVPFEAESFIPLPVDQVYLDWQKLSETEDKMNILIIASPKDFIDKYLSVLAESGVKVVALEVESQSCHRALVSPQSAETVLLLDLDAFRSSLIMVEEGKLQFTSSVPIAGNTFTESIAVNLGISSAKAEEIKKKVGIANTPNYPNIKTALLPVLNNLSGEIKSILKFHNEHSDKTVSKVILAGGSAKLKYLPEFLAPQLADFGQLKVETGNPWQNLPALKDPPLDPLSSLGYVTAIGLAMRGLN